MLFEEFDLICLTIFSKVLGKNVFEIIVFNVDVTSINIEIFCLIRYSSVPREKFLFTPLITEFLCYFKPF